jgi:hypothetical protein
MNVEHLISLINLNCTKIEDLKRLQNTVKLLIEIETIRQSFVCVEPKEITTLQQMKLQNFTTNIKE